MINAFEVINTQGMSVINTGMPRKYRADCQMGQFKIGSSKIVGAEMKVEILGYEIEDGEFFGYPPQPWLSIAFVDKSRYLSHILFKTQSIDSFSELLTTLSEEGKPLGSQIVTCTMKKGSSRKNGSNFWYVDFSAEDNKKERFDELVSFMKNENFSMPQLIESKEEVITQADRTANKLSGKKAA